MERLTNKREADAQRKEYEIRISNGYPRNIPEERFLRLAAYEDTDREPEEVEMDHEAAEELHRLCQYCDLDRLEKLAEADKAGRVVVLPCKPDGSMLDTSDPERPEIMKRIHFAVAYVCGGIVFHQPYNMFLENVAAGYIRPLNEEVEAALEAKRDVCP